MAGAAAHAYPYVQPRWRTETPARPDFRVLPGRGASVAERIGASPLFFTVLKVVVAAVLFIAAVGVCRVALTAATVETMISSDQLTSQISSARSQGSELEVKVTTLANPTRIKAYASEHLGMAVATSTSYIDLASGALATDSEGNLSLAGTISTIESSGKASGSTMKQAVTTTPAASGTSDTTVDTQADSSAELGSSSGESVKVDETSDTALSADSEDVSVVGAETETDIE